MSFLPDMCWMCTGPACIIRCRSSMTVNVAVCHSAVGQQAAMSQHQTVALLTQLQQDHQLPAASQPTNQRGSQLVDIAHQVDQLKRNAGTRLARHWSGTTIAGVLEGTAADLGSRLKRVERDIANLLQRPAPPTPSHGSTVSMFAREYDSDSDADSPAPSRIPVGGNTWGEFPGVSQAARTGTSGRFGAQAATTLERTMQAAAAAWGHSATAAAPASSRAGSGATAQAPDAGAAPGAGAPAAGSGPVLHIETDHVKQLLLASCLLPTEELDKNALARHLLPHLPPEDRSVGLQYVIRVVNPLLYQLEDDGRAQRRLGSGTKPLWRRT